MKTSPNLVWIDMEMTGLNPEKDKVLEIAVIITDSNLNILDESIDIAIKQSRYVLNRMNSWCKKHHGKSGLTERCLKSKVTLNETKRKVLRLVKKYCDKRTGVLSGNSVYVDRKYLAKYFPKVDKYLSHRLIDVTTIKELSKRWFLNDVAAFQEHKDEDVAHRALDDIKYSIKELKFYREKIFKKI